MNKIEKVKNHFEEEAKEYDGVIIRLIPYYTQMVEAIVSAIPREENDVFEIMDLGCGTGTVSKSIKDHFPKARITCIDLVPKMIEIAKAKHNAKDGSITYQTGDFHHYNFDKKYDAIVSSLALHHLISDEEKKTFYGKIYEALNPKGVFYNADVILASTDSLQRVYMEKWKEYMGRSVPQEEIESRWMRTYEEEDSPAAALKQLEWLKEIGFKGIDVLWKYYNFAVYGGMK